MTRLYLLAFLFLAGCSPAVLLPTPTFPVPATPTAPATLTPTPTPAPPATLTATPTETASPSPTPTVTETPPPTLLVPLTPTPGLIVHGHVTLPDGSGLPGVTICRNYASYGGVVIATTGSDGSFQSDFAFIPGDEMVSVWPLAPGYTFQPESVRWRHYYGPEDRTLDFIASPTSATAVPFFPCR